MKTTGHGLRHGLVALALFSAGAGSVSAQLVELKGSVTGVHGAFEGRYAPGSAVVVGLDLTGPLVDEFPESGELSLYRNRPLSFRIGGDRLPVDSWPSEVWVSRGLGGWCGVSVGASWPAIDPPRVVVFALLGRAELVGSAEPFPAGVRMECFEYRDGVYLGDGGTIDWTIESYGVRAASLAVPEPAGYGAVAALLALALIGRRRWRKA